MLAAAILLPMSQEAVEVVRRIYAAVSRGDMAAALASYDADVEFDLTSSPFRDLVPHHVVRGHDGLREFFRERQDAWESMEDELVELTVAGNHVITEVITRGRGRASGIDAELIHHALWEVRDGKVVRTRWFMTRAEALAAASADPD